MSKTKTDRGNSIYLDRSEGQWKYLDDGLPVVAFWHIKPCGICNKARSRDWHDPCIANLPGAVNACCGHGVVDKAYAKFEDGSCIEGAEAVDHFKEYRASLEEASVEENSELTSIHRKELASLLKVAAAAYKLKDALRDHEDVVRALNLEMVKHPNGLQ